MTEVLEMLANAQTLERAGELPHAEVIYRRVVEHDESSVDGWFRLGIACLKQRKYADAVDSLQRVTALIPDFAEAWSNLGVALASMGQPQTAVTVFRRALDLLPTRADLHRNLASALQTLGRYEEATSHLEQSLAIEPTSAAALFCLASIMRVAGKAESAIETLKRCLMIDTSHVQAIVMLSQLLAEQGQLDMARAGFERAIQLEPNLTRAYVGLGVVLARKNLLPDAVQAFQHALAIDPGCAEAHSNLGFSLSAAGQDQDAIISLKHAARLYPEHIPTLFKLAELCLRHKLVDEAVVHYQTIIRLQPDYAQAHLNLGIAFTAQAKFEEASRCCHNALKLKPDYATALNSIGTVFERQGKFGDAMKSFNQALELEPDFAEAHCNLAVLEMLHGNWEKGFAEYEWRWRSAQSALRTYDFPLWDGGSLVGKTILLHAEQGLGDTIQFIRYAPLVKHCGGRVVVACQASLMAILSSCSGIDQLISLRDPAPKVDVRAPLMSLPRLLKSTPSNVPNAVPYLTAEPKRERYWCDRLTGISNFRVGIAWRGNPNQACDRYRSVPLELFEPLCCVAGTKFYSLQKGNGIEEIAKMADRFSVVDFGTQLDSTYGTFLDTAAVMKSLDLVISIDSALGHLAGALGLPVWAVLGVAADWRWLLNREDTPWYPTMRLFRQQDLGQWTDVFRKMADELALQVQFKNSRPEV